MIMNNNLLVICVAAIVACMTTSQQVAAKKQNFFERPGILPRDILEARGYLAKDFHLVSEDGYRLRVTRGRNPLINNGQGGLPGRVPILFIHGVLESFNVFVINSFDVRPSDFSKLNLKGVPLEDLNSRLGDVPSAKSLPLLAMDFGHEVFIMSRRGFPGSRSKIGDPNKGVNDEAAGEGIRGPLSGLWRGLTNYGHLAQEMRFSLDRKFWNFSGDEQAQYDFPLVVNFIREHTKRDKVAVVGQSLGGAITLMALSTFPELNDKISAAILWSQAFSIGNSLDLPRAIIAIKPLLHYYVGAMPPQPLTGHLQRLLNVVCSTKLLQSTLCAALGDFFLGYSAGLAPMPPEFINSCFYTSSSHELEQTMQAALLGGQMHHYAHNRLEDAKPYDLSRITNTKLSFYLAPTDNLATYPDTKATLPKLKVPYRAHHIKQAFNHLAYFFHTNTSRIAIIPSLQDIHELSEPTPVDVVTSRTSVPVINLNATVARQ